MTAVYKFSVDDIEENDRFVAGPPCLLALGGATGVEPVWGINLIEPDKLIYLTGLIAIDEAKIIDWAHRSKAVWEHEAERSLAFAIMSLMATDEQMQIFNTLSEDNPNGDSWDLVTAAIALSKEEQ